MFFPPIRPDAYQESLEEARRHWFSAIREFMAYLAQTFGTRTDGVLGDRDVAAATSWNEDDLDSLLAIDLRRPGTNDPESLE